MQRLFACFVASFALGLAFAAHATPGIEALAYQAPNGPGKSIALTAELRIPEGATPPYKLIILQHSSGPRVGLPSFKGRTDSIAMAVGLLALQRNYAVVFTDSFTPRDIRESHRIDSQEIGSRELSRDLIALVRVLQNDPRIDKDQLFFFGHSLGGSMAMELSYPEMWERARWLQKRPTPFKAVVASAPGCHLFRDEKVGQALKIFAGSLDDWTPPKACLALVEHQKNVHAHTVELEIISGVGHSYSANAGWNARAISFRGCTDQPVLRARNGQFSQSGEQITYEDYKQRCHRVGASTGGEPSKTPEVMEKIVSFFDSFSAK